MAARRLDRVVSGVGSSFVRFKTGGLRASGGVVDVRERLGVGRMATG